MASDRVEQYRRWFTYEQDVHAKVLASFDSVPADRRSAAEFKKAVTLFGHVVAARRMWLFRFGIAPTPPATIFPENQEIG
jgi:uncharacterized damage-inducible protein DinB